MLNFEIKLSLSSCEVLTDLVTYTDALDKQTKKNLNTHETASLFGSMVRHKMSHFISHGHVLIRNGLAMHTGKTWRVTPKGRLVAKVIQIELAEAAQRTKAKV